MTEADREKARWIRNGLVYAGAEDLCRIIRELEADRDEWAKAQKFQLNRASQMTQRWRKAGSTIRRLRAERDQWKRTATEKGYRCSACGEVLDGAQVDSVGGHCAIGRDDDGDAVQVHCGPCYPIEASEPRIRELEADRDGVATQDAALIESLARRWRHAGRTIRRLRRRWRWERRRAARLNDECERWLADYMRQNEDFYKEREYASTLASERDDLRARCERMEKASRDFYNAWIVCESNRGCYSTAEAHDCRCALPRRGEKCNCGRDELEAASEQVDAALKEASDGR